MKKNISILKTVAWIIIGLWITRFIIFNLVNLDFATHEIAQNFRLIWYVLFPLAIGILIVNSWNGKRPVRKQILNLTGGIIFSISVVFVFNFLNGFCACRYSKVLYRHKTENIQIRERKFDCGAWDSDMKTELVEAYSIGDFLIKYSVIEKNDIDPENWIRE